MKAKLKSETTLQEMVKHLEEVKAKEIKRILPYKNFTIVEWD